MKILNYNNKIDIYTINKADYTERGIQLIQIQLHTFVDIVQYMMKFEEELIITRRWLADSIHKSQDSGTQY